MDWAAPASIIIEEHYPIKNVRKLKQSTPEKLRSCGRKQNSTTRITKEELWRARREERSKSGRIKRGCSTGRRIRGSQEEESEDQQAKQSKNRRSGGRKVTKALDLSRTNGRRGNKNQT